MLLSVLSDMLTASASLWLLSPQLAAHRECVARCLRAALIAARLASA